MKKVFTQIIIICLLKSFSMKINFQFTRSNSGPSHWEPAWIEAGPGEHLPPDLDQVARKRCQRRSTQSSQRGKSEVIKTGRY